MPTKSILKTALLCALAMATTGLVSRPGNAAYPDRPVTVIVASAAGGSVDLLARILTTQLAASMGQPFVVENRPGGEGLLGNGIVAKAKPDGYTISVNGGSETTAPALHRTIAYDPRTQLIAIAEVARTPIMIVASTKAGVKTLAELIDHIKKNPGKLNAATSGNGSRLSTAAFQIRTGTQFTVVPFAQTPQINPSLMAGETDFGVMDTLAWAGMAGQPGITLLAIASDKRLPNLPDTPTATEAGLPGFTISSIYGVYTTGGTPPAIIEQLNKELNRVTALPEVIEQFHKISLTRSVTTVAEAQKAYLDQLVKWKEVAREVGLEAAD